MIIAKKKWLVRASKSERTQTGAHGYIWWQYEQCVYFIAYENE